MHERIEERLNRRTARSRHGQEPIREGAATRLYPVRELVALSRTHEPASEAPGHLSGSDRAARCPNGKIPPQSATLAGQGRGVGVRLLFWPIGRACKYFLAQTASGARVAQGVRDQL